MASGDFLFGFLPEHNTPPVVNPAVPVWRNNHLVLGFNDTTSQTAVFKWVLPSYYAGGGITVYVSWAAATAVTNNIGWRTAFERIGVSQDIDVDSIAADKTIVAVTVNATAGIPTTTSIGQMNTEIDGLLVNEVFRLFLTRNTAVDTAVGDAQLIMAWARET